MQVSSSAQLQNIDQARVVLGNNWCSGVDRGHRHAKDTGRRPLQHDLASDLQVRPSYRLIPPRWALRRSSTARCVWLFRPVAESSVAGPWAGGCTTADGSRAAPLARRTCCCGTDRRAARPGRRREHGHAMVFQPLEVGLGVLALSVTLPHRAALAWATFPAGRG